MDVPGSSIFAGAGSLHIDRSAQERLEEQEDLEDRQRRAVELKADLDHAFDDFVDEDEPSSVDSSHERTSLEAARSIHTAARPSGPHARNRNPPSYGESLGHLKETGSCDAPVQAHDAQKLGQHGCQHYEAADACRSPCGAGDAQDNFYYPNDYRVPGHLVGHHNGMNSYESKQQQLNYENLNMMYNMRVKECQQLAEQLVAAQRAGETETEALRARLAAALSDAEQARLSLQEAQHLLATNKHQVIELQQELVTHKQAAARAAADKESAAQELHATMLALQEAQQRLQQVKLERNHNTDVLFREQQDRHREECERLRDDLERAKNRIEEKEKEVLSLERRCSAAERARGEAAAERGAAVNQLAAELETAQARAATTALQLKDFGTRLQQNAKELMLSRNEHDEWRARLQQIVRDAATADTPYIASSPASTGDLATLKEMLSRYKQQSQQIGQLTQETRNKDKLLEECRQLESELRAQLQRRDAAETQLRSRAAALERKAALLGAAAGDGELAAAQQRSRQLEAQLDTLRADLKAVELNYTELELRHDRLRSEAAAREGGAERDTLAAQLREATRENDELKSLYLQVCSARDALARELNSVQSQLSQLQKEKDALCEREKSSADDLDRERKHALQLSTELSKERAELEQVRKKIVEQQKEYTEKQKEFADKLDKYIREESAAVCQQSEPCAQCASLARSLAELQAQAQQYRLRLEAQESNELLLKELRSKAEYFERYIVQRFQRLTDQRHVATNTEAVGDECRERRRPDGHDASPDREPAAVAEDDAVATRMDMMMKEKHIREQLAEQFTLEIKTIEMNCTKKMNDLQNENTAIVSRLKELLEKKAQEVEVLKKFVVSERAKITEILQAKEKDIAVVIKENRSLQEEYRLLRAKTDELRAELEGRTAELVAEREAAARVHAQHGQLRDKYRAVKKTALGYKEYASKKDVHVETELERIKSHYEAELARLNEKLQRVIKKKRDMQVNERISKMQSNFDAMVSEVNSAT